MGPNINNNTNPNSDGRIKKQKTNDGEKNTGR